MRRHTCGKYAFFSSIAIAWTLKHLVWNLTTETTHGTGQKGLNCEMVLILMVQVYTVQDVLRVSQYRVGLLHTHIPTNGRLS